MTTGYVAVIPEPRVLTLQEVEVADPEEGEVQIRAISTLVSTGTEMTAYSGDFPREKSAWANYVKYPFRTGYSHVGEIVKVGPGVTGLSVGDRVFSHAHHASLTVQPVQRVVRVPDGVSADQAAFSSISAIAMNGVRMAEIALGEAVVIVGLGIVGQMAMRYARLSGAFPLIAVDVSEERLRTATTAGATHTINPMQEDTLSTIQTITKGEREMWWLRVRGNLRVFHPSAPCLGEGEGPFSSAHPPAKRRSTSTTRSTPSV